ncbi:DUF4097 family beta strand repeat-containing protein [Nonomuraea longicatena]|uniref:DUF4097 family beta strand repeat-containing protein n=1 Tax=Nonomuraea longicatena TaxID=83682 RepID=A0ABN1R002_9ACTN
MHVFDTPEPVSALVAVPAGRVSVQASDRPDTVVEVVAEDPDDDDDLAAARLTQVEYSRGELHVKTPRQKKNRWFGWSGSVEVRIQLPSGSRLDVEATADVHGTGRLGDTRLVISAGDVRLDETGRLQLRTQDGDVSVRRTLGHTEVTTTNGDIRVREIDGTAVAKTSNGDITIGSVSGELRLSTGSGDITVGTAQAGVGAKSAYGRVEVGEVARGAVVAESNHGEVEVGVRPGTSALLDVSSNSGEVQVTLDACDGPAETEESVRIRAHSTWGDILIRRA